MDYNQQFYEMRRNQLPLYYSYPMQRYYYEETEYERDLDRLKNIFPGAVRTLQEQVEKACDQLDYEGSPLYDECPDQVTMHLLCKKIQGMQEDGEQEQVPMELIEMTLFHELHRRRCRYQRSRHCW